MRMTIPTAARIVLTVLVVLLVGTGSAFAETCSDIKQDCTYTFNAVNNTSALGSLSSYGTVELKLMSGQIQFLVNLAPGYLLVNSQNAFGFNSSISPDPTVTLAPGATSGYGLGSLGVPGSNQYDGFGSFEYNITGPQGTTNGVNSVTFTIGLSGGGSFTDVHQLVEGSTQGNGTGANVPSLFAAHLYNTDPACGSACTGIAGVTGTAVPEPSSYLWLMGAGFGLIVLVIERRRRRTA